MSVASQYFEDPKVKLRRAKVKKYDRHEDIDDNLVITLEHIRDFANSLKIVKHAEEPANAYYRNIYLQNPEKVETKYLPCNPIESSGSKGNVPSEFRTTKPSVHTIYMIVQLSSDNGKPMTTPIKNFMNLDNEKIEFPIKIKDVTIHTMVGITIYDMNRMENDGLVASTTINLFDSKKRLRQGTFDLYLWNNSKVDLSFRRRTPGLPPNNEFSEKINSLLGKIDDRSEYDQMTHTAINRHIQQYYIDSKSAFLEISLPLYDFPVLYEENIYSSAKKDITYPSYLSSQYKEFYKSEFASSVHHADISRKLSLDKTAKISKVGMIKFHDPVIQKKGNFKERRDQDNPLMEKYYTLTRTNNDNIARGLNIDAVTQKEILNIIEHPDFTTLTRKEESLLWKFRYPIKGDKQYRKAVVKFLLSVDWEIEKEAKEAIGKYVMVIV